VGHHPIPTPTGLHLPHGANYHDQMPQSLSAVYIHAIFSTLERAPYLRDPELRGRMHGYLVGTSKGLGCPSVAVGGVADHVHILAMLGRTVSQADWIRELKRASNKWVKASIPTFAWQAGYGAFSVGTTDVEAVKVYIHNQEAHHRKMTFQEEYQSFLIEHGLEWDERYIWD